MESILVIVLIVAASAIPVLLYLIFAGRSRRARAVSQRIRGMRETEGQVGGLGEGTQTHERVLFPTVDRFIAGRGFTQNLLERLGRAGWHVKPSEYVGAVIGAVGVGAILGMAVAKSPIGAVVGAVLGYLIPRAALGIAIGRRKAALEGQISDMVMLVSSALKSGYSFLKALQVVARELPPPISEVSRKVVEECQLGVPMEDALQRMAARVGSYDMDLVVSAVVIQSQVGGSLSEVLESIGGTIRDRIQIQAEVSALTAEGRLTGIVLMLLTPTMAAALWVINPGYMSVLVDDPMGIKMIVATVVLNILGYIWMRKMMRLDV